MNFPKINELHCFDLMLWKRVVTAKIPRSIADLAKEFIFLKRYAQKNIVQILFLPVVLFIFFNFSIYCF